MKKLAAGIQVFRPCNYVKPSGGKDNGMVPGNAFPKLDVRRRLLAGRDPVKPMVSSA